ncbi:tetratricopeptide repeat protein [Prosthecochloris vibrioformis]|uniref:Regulator of microtubule dynamics protein 1 n=1 Tax=Prosthecochloris vibrioformis TaxID=1098 RepID=A0A5C4S0K8_PROVB|nr:tetratricopeptide repeat protein [Prosthecochloris vibrioformis]TNJ36954.1 tetratricopeptide repeat protein [Prosthecochloris vibrioformis]
MRRTRPITAREKVAPVMLLCGLLVSCSGGEKSGVIRSQQSHEQIPVTQRSPATHEQSLPEGLHQGVTSSYGLRAAILKPQHHAETTSITVKPDKKKPPPPSPEMIFRSKLRKADAAFAAMDYEKAEHLYRSLLVGSPEKAELHWKLARLYISTGESLPRSASLERRQWFDKAIQHARQSVRLDETCGRCHTWLAAALGVHADDLGAKEKIRNANTIKTELERALALDPKDDIAWSILGSFNREIAGIGWVERMVANAFLGEVPKGSYEEAERMFLKAIALNPDIIRHHYELGLLYREQKRYTEALRVFRIALTKPLQMKSDIQRKENMRSMTEKLSGLP